MLEPPRATFSRSTPKTRGKPTSPKIWSGNACLSLFLAACVGVCTLLEQSKKAIAACSKRPGGNWTFCCTLVLCQDHRSLLFSWLASRSTGMWRLGKTAVFGAENGGPFFRFFFVFFRTYFCFSGSVAFRLFGFCGFCVGFCGFRGFSFRIICIHSSSLFASSALPVPLRQAFWLWFFAS